MSNQVISMQQIRALIQLLEKGCSLRAISAQLGISRQPVTIYVARLKSSTFTTEELRHLSDADLAAIIYDPPAQFDFSDDTRRIDFMARVPYYLTELKRIGVTRLLLWEEYCKEYNNLYRYTRFCVLLKEASKPTQATMHLVYTPAAMVMVDFAGDKMSYVDRDTGVFEPTNQIVKCKTLGMKSRTTEPHGIDGRNDNHLFIPSLSI